MIEEIKVGDKVVLKEGMTVLGKSDCIRTVIGIFEKENEHGYRYKMIEADGGEPCKTCGLTPSIPLQSGYGWFEKVEE